METDETNINLTKRKILITGGTGLIGTHLTKILKNKGYQIAILSRDPSKVKHAEGYFWNLETGEMDRDCLNGVDTIIHLAGANIGSKRWTKKRKQEIIFSRTCSIQMIYKAIEETQSPVQAVISSSAVGYYGDRGNEILTEKSDSGTGFLAECCRQWENAVMKGEQFDLRVVRLRIGFLLTKKGGALSRLAKPVRYFLGFPLGSGKQWMPWIHQDDLWAMFVEAIENSDLQGAYNTCAPFPVTNKKMTKELAKQLHRPAWSIHVPEFILKAILGEKSSLILMSDRTSSEKIVEAGFRFKFTELDAALSDIYNR